MQPTRSSSPSSDSSSATSNLDVDATSNFKTFKHIPVRVYKADHLLPQRLVKPTRSGDNNGPDRLATLQDLLLDYLPKKDDISKGKT